MGTFFHGNSQKKAWRKSMNRVLLGVFPTQSTTA